MKPRVRWGGVVLVELASIAVGHRFRGFVYHFGPSLVTQWQVRFRLPAGPQRIDAPEFPVAHHTIRKGSPYTLRLVKQRDLHQREAEQRRQATVDLEWLSGEG